MVDLAGSSIQRWLSERGWSRRRVLWLALLLLPIWLPFLQALAAYAQRRISGTDSLRDFAFAHGYPLLYGLPLIVALVILLFGRMSLALRFYGAVLYALVGFIVGWFAIEIFELSFG